MPAMHRIIYHVSVCILMVLHGGITGAEECGTRFVDFTSSVYLADVVIKGAVSEFNPTPFATQVRSANVSVQDVYKGMDILKSTGGMNEVEVQSFGTEDKDDCVATDDDTMMRQDMVFFLRQSPDRRKMEHSALPLPADGTENQRVRRSLCDTCIKPPIIRRLVCNDCTKEPTIKPMKSRKVTMGRRARLRCSVRGKPAPEISWFKNELPVMSGNGGVTIRTTALTSTLIFSRTTSAHSGQYKCVASNDVGEAEEFVTLEISRKLRKKKPNKSSPQSVLDAPDKVHCVVNPCLNGGTCFYSQSVDLRLCVCSSGFEGVTCENEQIYERVSDNNNPHDTTRSLVTETSSTSQVNQSGESTSKATTSSSNAQSKIHMEAPLRNATTLKTHPSSTFVTTINITQSSDTKTQPTPLNRITIGNAIMHNTTKTTTPTPIVKSRPLPALTRTRYTRPSSRYGQVVGGYPLKKKSSLKIIPCREKRYCANLGKCRYISKLKKKFCQCRKGYGGSRCELVLS